MESFQLNLISHKTVPRAAELQVLLELPSIAYLTGILRYELFTMDYLEGLIA